MSKRTRFHEVFRAGRWFGGLPPPFQAELLAAGVERKLVKGERLFSRGDPPTGIFGVAEGAIQATTVAPSGQEALLAIVYPPMWFGEICTLDGLPRTHDAVADAATVVLHVPEAALQSILAAEPRYWRDLGELTASRLRLMYAAVEDMVVAPLSVRLARRLSLSAERYGEWQDRSSRVLDLRQDQLAAMLSTSRQTVNQLLKDLEARGVLRLAYGTIEILDIEGLRRAAEPPP